MNRQHTSVGRAVRLIIKGLTLAFSFRWQALTCGSEVRCLWCWVTVVNKQWLRDCLFSIDEWLAIRHIFYDAVALFYTTSVSHDLAWLTLVVYNNAHSPNTNINKVCAWRHNMPPPLRVDNIFAFIRQMAPVPACWLFKTSATSWPLSFLPWKWCPSHVWRGLPLCQF